MDRAGMTKVAAAFLAGLTVALGSAVLYVKTNPTPHLQAVPQSGFVPKENVVVSTEAPSPLEREEPAPVAVGRHQIARARSRSYLRPPILKNEPIPIAQNTPVAAIGFVPPISTPESEPAVLAPAAISPPEPIAVAPLAHVVTLAARTRLVIRLGESLSTDHNYAGDTFRGVLEEPIVQDGFIIADKGSKVLGRIATAEKAGRVRGLADMKLQLTEINTTDGQRVPIETASFHQRAPGSGGTDVAEVAGGAALGALIGGLSGGGKGAAIGAGAGGAAGTGVALATRGRPVVLPNETRLTFALAAPVTITEKINQ